MNQPQQRQCPRPEGGRHWELPPLILHPFSGSDGPDTLLDCSRAQLMLAGVLPAEGFTRDALTERVLRGRLYELRMLFYVGLDLERWLEQCEEFAGHEPQLRPVGLTRGSFAALLVQEAPGHVDAKLRNWGVADYKSLFARALGINAVFGEAPEPGHARQGFLLDYHRFANGFFRSWNEGQGGLAATPDQFIFNLYASGEYSQILESQWEKDLDTGRE